MLMAVMIAGFIFLHPISAWLWALYLACLGLGNAITYLAHRLVPDRGTEEAIEAGVVALVLLACSPVPMALALCHLVGWHSWAHVLLAVAVVMASYLWAGLRLYRRAEAVLAGVEG